MESNYLSFFCEELETRTTGSVSSPTDGDYFAESWRGGRQAMGGIQLLAKNQRMGGRKSTRIFWEGRIKNLNLSGLLKTENSFFIMVI